MIDTYLSLHAMRNGLTRIPPTAYIPISLEQAYNLWDLNKYEDPNRKNQIVWQAKFCVFGEFVEHLVHVMQFRIIE